MILDYLLWMATGPIRILYWLYTLQANLRDVGCSRTTQINGATRRAQTSGSTNTASRTKQGAGPGLTESTASITSEDADARRKCLARVLEIIPDVEPDHLARLINNALVKHGSARVLEHVLHGIFEKPNYPKVKVNSSKKTERAGQNNLTKVVGGASKPKFDYGYGNKSRPFTGGADYPELALVWWFICSFSLLG